MIGQIAVRTHNTEVLNAVRAELGVVQKDVFYRGYGSARCAFIVFEGPFRTKVQCGDLPPVVDTLAHLRSELPACPESP